MSDRYHLTTNGGIGLTARRTVSLSDALLYVLGHYRQHTIYVRRNIGSMPDINNAYVLCIHTDGHATVSHHGTMLTDDQSINDYGPWVTTFITALRNATTTEGTPCPPPHPFTEPPAPSPSTSSSPPTTTSAAN